MELEKQYAAGFPLTEALPFRYKDAPTTVGETGYLWEWCPGHPRATEGVVPQHRLVMEEILGRYLTPHERVHHKNHDRKDNRPENLELYASQDQHMKAHWQNKGSRDPELVARVREIAGNPDVPMAALGISPTTLRKVLDLNPDIRWAHRKNHVVQAMTDAQVREALQGKTALEAADHLGVHVQTLYNRYDHLLRKRASPGSLDQYRAEILQEVYGNRTPQGELALRFGVSRNCVARSIRRWKREDAIPAEFAHATQSHLRPGPVPGRKVRDTGALSPEQLSALGESLLNDLLSRP